MKNRLVAHRGDMTTYPENSLLAFTKAAQLGFKHIELDVQLSSDHVPIVMHDPCLKRTTGIDKQVTQLLADKLASYKLKYQNNLSCESHGLLQIATLEQTIDQLNIFSDINLFVEVKRESIDYFDLEIVMKPILKAVSQAKFTVVIISFVTEVLWYVQERKTHPVGWVLKKYNDEYREIAELIQPEYLYCNVKKISDPSKLWEGDWQWALYDIKDPKKARNLLEQGVDLIETGDIVKLTNSEYFQ